MRPLQLQACCRYLHASIMKILMFRNRTPLYFCTQSEAKLPSSLSQTTGSTDSDWYVAKGIALGLGCEMQLGAVAQRFSGLVQHIAGWPCRQLGQSDFQESNWDNFHLWKQEALRDCIHWCIVGAKTDVLSNRNSQNTSLSRFCCATQSQMGIITLTMPFINCYFHTSTGSTRIHTEWNMAQKMQKDVRNWN